MLKEWHTNHDPNNQNLTNIYKSQSIQDIVKEIAITNKKLINPNFF